VEIVSIWSASYSLEKNSGSRGGVTSFIINHERVQALYMLLVD